MKEVTGVDELGGVENGHVSKRNKIWRRRQYFFTIWAVRDPMPGSKRGLRGGGGVVFATNAWTDAGFATPTLFPITHAHLHPFPGWHSVSLKESTPRCIGVGEEIERWQDAGNDGGAISIPAPFPVPQRDVQWRTAVGEGQLKRRDPETNSLAVRRH